MQLQLYIYAHELSFYLCLSRFKLNSSLYKLNYIKLFLLEFNVFELFELSSQAWANIMKAGQLLKLAWA